MLPYKLTRELRPADEALREAGAALTTLRFVAGGAVVAAADRCMDVLADLMSAYAAESAQGAKIDDLLEEMNIARHGLVTETRAELGVEPLSR